jgi:predicted lipoprotein with Yx(FWY)xxD motif
MLVVAAIAVVGAVVVLVTVLTRSPATEQRREQLSLDDGRAVGIARTKLGPILVNGQGRTLYMFLEDRHGKSTCYGACARVWPPAISRGTPRVGPGVAAAKLTTTRRRDRQRQLVYNGHPLYAMSADSRPGEMAGQGFLGTWFVVSPAGHRVAAPGSAVPDEY